MSFDYRQAMERELLRDPSLSGLVTEITEKVLDAAVGGAPVRTGAYRDSLDMSVGVGAAGMMVGRVLSTDPFAHLVEFGSVNNPPYAPLRRAVESVGLTVTDSRAR